MQRFVIVLKKQLEGWMQLRNDPCHPYSILFDHTQKRLPESKDTKEPSLASFVNANYGCSKEADCAATQVIFQDMLQVRRQKPHLGIKVQEVPWESDEA
jgi:hypothetical protein